MSTYIDKRTKEIFKVPHRKRSFLVMKPLTNKPKVGSIIRIIDSKVPVYHRWFNKLFKIVDIDNKGCMKCIPLKKKQDGTCYWIDETQNFWELVLE